MGSLGRRTSRCQEPMGQRATSGTKARWQRQLENRSGVPFRSQPAIRAYLQPRCLEEADGIASQWPEMLFLFWIQCISRELVLLLLQPCIVSSNVNEMTSSEGCCIVCHSHARNCL